MDKPAIVVAHVDPGLKKEAEAALSKMGVPVDEAAVVVAHVDPDLKKEAEAVLSKMGMSVDEAVTQLYKRLTSICSEPFSPHIPNAETIAAMNQGKDREGLPKHSSFGEFMATLD